MTADVQAVKGQDLGIAWPVLKATRTKRASAQVHIKLYQCVCLVLYRFENVNCYRFVLSFSDVDECGLPDAVCTEEHQECVNTNGSYRCRCAGGFQEQDGVCVQQAQPGTFL